MLVSVFKAANNSKNRVVGIRPVVERLQPFDQCPRFRVQPLDRRLKILSPLGGIDHEITVFVPGPDVFGRDWETSTPLALSRDGGNDDIVQSAAKVMCEITEDSSDPGVRWLGNTHAVPDFLWAS
mgnify:CR=1 FL=1